MKSPVGSHQKLEQVSLNENLIAYQCPETGGTWIPPENYWKWQHYSDSEESNNQQTPPPIPTGEFDNTVKLCPVTGTIMTRYRVGHGYNFRIDRSITGGIWLDAGEWENLQAGNLHHILHLIFSAPWQKTVRNEDHAAQYDTLLRKRLGNTLYTKLSTLRDELTEHPARQEALAYLQNKQPI